MMSLQLATLLLLAGTAAAEPTPTSTSTSTSTEPPPAGSALPLPLPSGERAGERGAAPAAPTAASADPWSLDLTVGTVGLGIGSSKHIDGLRLAFRDSAPSVVHGASVTIWSPENGGRVDVSGLAIGLPLHVAGRLRGVGVGIGLGASEGLDGVGVGLLGAGGGDRVRGLLVGGLGAGAEIGSRASRWAAWAPGRRQPRAPRLWSAPGSAGAPGLVAARGRRGGDLDGLVVGGLGAVGGCAAWLAGLGPVPRRKGAGGAGRRRASDRAGARPAYARRRGWPVHRPGRSRVTLVPASSTGSRGALQLRRQPG
jgi:hypothetical protein